MHDEVIPSPCFVLEEERLKSNLALLRRVQEEAGCTIILALKGFAMFHAFPVIREVLPGTTASSLHEAMLGQQRFGGAVHACAPVYIPDELHALLEIVSHITFNSLSEWDRYRPLLAEEGHRVSVGLRINPEHSEVETDLYNPGCPGSRLGVAPDELGDRLPAGIEGLHFHSLCECGSDALERTLARVEEQYGPLLAQAKWLNMGGGHLITRADYDVDLLIRLIRRIRETYDLEVIQEPGAAVAWQTGYLSARVLDKVERRGVRTLMLDVSFSAHMPDCLEMPYRPRIAGARDPQPGEVGWRLGGLTCLAGDFLADYVFEREPEVGDRLRFEDMMHYTMVKTTCFNGVGHPAIGIEDASGKIRVVREFGYEDYERRMG